MSDAPDTTTDSTGATLAPRRHDDSDHRRNRLQNTLAWVGIIAGVVFTVAVIFFSGFILGRSPGGYHGWQRGYHGGQMGPGAGMKDCPMMRQGGMMGPGGMDPEDMGPGMMRPGQPTAAPGPATPPTPR